MFVQASSTNRGTVSEWGINPDFVAAWKIEGEVLYIYMAGMPKDDAIVFLTKEAVELIEILRASSLNAKDYPRNSV